MRGDEPTFPPVGLPLLLLHPDADHGGNLRAHSTPARQKGIYSDEWSDPDPIILEGYIRAGNKKGRIQIRYLRRIRYGFLKFDPEPVFFLVLIIDGNSELVAHS